MIMESIASPPGVPSSIEVRPGLVVVWNRDTAGGGQQWQQVALVRECPDMPGCWVVHPVGVREPVERHAHTRDLRTACPICGTFAHRNIEDPNELRRCNDQVDGAAAADAAYERMERRRDEAGL
jgi:hypothetical protein